MRSLTHLILILMGVTSSLSAQGDDRVGRQVEDFTLRDCFGRQHSVSAQADPHLTVVVFLGAECPLARLYAPRLERLYRQYRAQGVEFYGICSNIQDSNTSLLHFARSHGISFPLLRDVDQRVVELFAAQRTPEVFVLDETHTVRYHGRVDDQYAVEVKHRAPSRQYVIDALEELLAGQPVTVSQTEALGCLIGRVHENEPVSDVTWSNQISRIFQQHCQDCHRPGQIGPFPLLDYHDAMGWGEMIREVVLTGRMPPWHADSAHGTFANDARLSEEQIDLICTWVESGSPAGDPANLPPPREFADGWEVAEPDRVVYMSDMPFIVPAEGQVEYQWFTVDPGFEEDKWIKLVEVRPGNPSVVHHVTVFFWPPDVDWDLRIGDRINLLGGFSPGKRPITLGEWDGTARFVPAGSRLVFEMHYTPNGTTQTDRSSIALVFADPQQVRRQLSVVMAGQTDFEIPPGADNHRVDASYEFDEDSLLHALSPHMHLRGKAFRFVAHFPDGRRETLLNVPRFDFNWQTDYQLEQPRLMPRGTTIQCVAHFDNSSNNPRNPDPSKAIHWGDQIWDEMMIGGMAITPANQDLTRGLGQPRVVGSRDRSLRLAAAGLSICAFLAALAFGYQHVRTRTKAVRGT